MGERTPADPNGEGVARRAPPNEDRRALVRALGALRTLRLHEIGMTRTSPQKILAEGTDWRVLNEVKKELKG